MNIEEQDKLREELRDLNRDDLIRMVVAGAVVIAKLREWMDVQIKPSMDLNSRFERFERVMFEKVHDWWEAHLELDEERIDKLVSDWLELHMKERP